MAVAEAPWPACGSTDAAAPWPACGSEAGVAPCPGMRIGGGRRRAVSRMRGVVAVSHVGHGQQRTRIDRRHRCTQPFTHRQRAADVAGTGTVLGKEGEGVLAGRFDDHVEGLGGGDADLVHRQRMDVLAVDLDHRHLQARDAHIEVAHRRAVDEAQPDLLAAAEQAGPVAQRSGAVHQVGVGVRVDVRQVGGRHPHAAPGRAVAQGRTQPVVAYVAEEVPYRPLVVVVVLRQLLQAGEQTRRIHVGPVGQEHHVVAVVGERLGCDGIDDQRPVHAALFLEAGVAVVPVGAALANIELVQVALAAADAIEAETGHTIHVRRQQDAVPVDRRGVTVDRAWGQVVADPQLHPRAFAPAQDRCGHRTVDGDGGPRLARVVDRGLAHAQVKLRAGENFELARRA